MSDLRHVCDDLSSVKEVSYDFDISVAKTKKLTLTSQSSLKKN